MDIGIRVPCYRRWCGGDAVLAIARTVESLGFDSLWVQDHLVAPTGPDDDTAVLGLDRWMTPDQTPVSTSANTIKGYYAGDDWWLDPFATWGFLAAATERVRLASDVVVVPYRNALVQAKLIGTLDVLSNGRMIVGTGSGHVRAESSALGLDFEARGRMHDEHIRVMKSMLSKAETSFAGEFTTFGPARTLIRPVQQPHPPFYIGGHGRRSIRRAVELGEGWLPSVADADGLQRGIAVMHELCEQHGRTVPPAIALSLPDSFRFPIAGRTSSKPTTSPGQVIDTLSRHAELGVEHVSLGFSMPTLDVYLDQIETFAADVLPAVRATRGSDDGHVQRRDV